MDDISNLIACLFLILILLSPVIRAWSERVRAKDQAKIEAGTPVHHAFVTELVLITDALLAKLGRAIKALLVQMLGLAIGFALLAAIPFGLFLLMHFRIWPFDRTGHTVYAYACVARLNTPAPSSRGLGLAHWSVAPYEDGNCSGETHALSGSKLQFTADVANQRVVLITSQRDVLRLDKCNVFDNTNWTCTFDENTWAMKDGLFTGSGIYASEVFYVDYWDNLFLAAELKPEDIVGL